MHLPDHIDLRWESFDSEQAETWTSLLSDEEQERLETFKSVKRKRAFALGRTSARRLLAGRLGVAPEAVPLHVAPDGAVEVDGSPYHLSIAHTEEYAVVAAAERDIGVDLERIVPRRPDLYRFLFYPEDYPLFEALELDRAHAHVLCWTLKEATLKAMRTGFRRSPKDVRLSINTAAQSARAQVDGRRWQLQFEERSGCYLTVAYDGTEG
ncbi:MAG: 4'-phosphopantetheinyl transferase family protein [Rhodothermales bacterium]